VELSCCSTTAADLAEADAADFVGEEALGGFEEADGVGQLGVMVEGGFVDPFGMDGEREGLADGFVDEEREAAGFGARWGVDAEEFVAEFVSSAGQGLEMNDGVEGHPLLCYYSMRMLPLEVCARMSFPPPFTI
jgi:hypothetical protein